MTEEKIQYHGVLHLTEGRLEAYPERNDKRVAALEAEVNRLRDEVEYMRLMLHKYVNKGEAE